METVPIVAGNQAATIANIKSIIDGNRAIWFGFFLPNETAWNNFSTFWNNQSESALFNMSGYCNQVYNQDTGGGHAVVLVGYNDTDPNPDNHYWELLNSWGTESGRPNGLFRIKMNMNYDCQYSFNYGPDDAFAWQTLNMQFQSTPTQCTYSISPQSEYVSASGGTRTVNVTASINTCAWTASESLGWITLNNLSGTGSGIVSYTVAANSGPQRSGTITIAGQTFTVTQEGAGGTGSNLLQNYSFEDGDNGIWIYTGAYDIYWDFPCDLGTTFCAYNGDWLAWLGGYDDAADDIYQIVTIPSGATSATLRFMYLIEAMEEIPGDWDFLYVYLWRVRDNYNVTLLTLSNMDITEGWVQSPVLNIPSEFIGEPVQIGFYGTTDADYGTWTNFFVDNVVLSVGLPLTEKLYLPLILK